MKTLSMTPALYEYALAHGVREHEVLSELRARTAELAQHTMQIAADQGAFMGMLIKLMGARHLIEVGTFTGYSTLAMALALPAEGGEIIACDVSEQWTAIAREHWEKAGVSDRIDLRIRPALETLDALLDEGRGGDFDLAFIDADKTGYMAYYERLLKLVRPGGVILVDNVLWSGHVIDDTRQDEDTLALRALNEHIRDDGRVETVMLPISDGLTMARVK